MSHYFTNINSILNELFFKKLSLVTPLIISSCALVTCQVSAHDVTVNITGAVTDATCTVSPDSVNKTVYLGKVPAKTFYRAGGSSLPVAFNINLEKCGAIANGVVISFSGTPDDSMTDLLKLSPESSASGIAIELMDDTQQLVAVGGSSRPYLITGGATTASLKFYSKMVANGEKFQPGSIISSVTFNTSYP
ncbi:fimbrial protein [Rahnella sp. PCH160]|uniref:fimbrial protein n=1 Tax=Rahnella sp. PCH160 TaxID=3447928 RepID=UPI0039FDBDD8